MTSKKVCRELRQTFFNFVMCFMDIHKAATHDFLLRKRHHQLLYAIRFFIMFNYHFGCKEKYIF